MTLSLKMKNYLVFLFLEMHLKIMKSDARSRKNSLTNYMAEYSFDSNDVEHLFVYLKTIGNFNHIFNLRIYHIIRQKSQATIWS